MIVEKILILGGLLLFLLGIAGAVYTLFIKPDRTQEVIAAQLKTLMLTGALGFIMAVNGFAINYQTVEQQREVKQLTNQVESLKSENAELRNIFSNSSNEVTDLTEQNIVLTQERDALLLENAELKKQNEELNNRIKEMEAKNETKSE